MSYFRRISFTIYDKNIDECMNIFKSWKSVTYCIMGNEICPDTGRKHLQCYAEFKNPVRFDTIKNKSKLLNDFHFENSMGNPLSNYEYCSKDGDFKEYGERLPDNWGQGNRTDLKKLTDELLNTNLTVDDIAIEQPTVYHQYGRTLSKIEDIKLRKKYRQWMTTCDWIYGKTGVGKSHKAFENYNPDTHYVWKLNDKGWQDGYTGQEFVIINDFRGQIPYDELLQLIDKYPYTIPRRGREPVPFLAKHITITSPMRPDEVYHNRHANDSIQQLLRRIEIIHLENVVDDVVRG